MMRKRPQVTRPYKDRQAEAMMFIRRAVKATGKFPTKNAIARAMGVRSAQSARDMLERLTIAGHLRRVKVPKVGYMYELARED